MGTSVFGTTWKIIDNTLVLMALRSANRCSWFVNRLVSERPMHADDDDYYFCMVDSLFANIVPDPVKISLEYLDLCREHPGTASFKNIQTHVRHLVEFQWYALFCTCILLNANTPSSKRCTWSRKFRKALNSCRTLDDIDVLLRYKMSRWRGKSKLMKRR